MDIEKLFEEERNRIIKQLGKEENQVPTFDYVLHYAYELQALYPKQKSAFSRTSSYWWKHAVETQMNDEGIQHPYCSNNMFKMAMYEVFPHGEALKPYLLSDDNFQLYKGKLYRTKTVSDLLD